MISFRFLFILPLLVVSGCSELSSFEEDEVRSNFRDPSSVEFRSIRKVEKGVCGEVNGKNGFGAYTGFKDFYYSRRELKAYVADDGVSFSSLWVYSMCNGK